MYSNIYIYNYNIFKTRLIRYAEAEEEEERGRKNSLEEE